MHQQRGPHCHQPHQNPAAEGAAQEGVGVGWWEGVGRCGVTQPLFLLSMAKAQTPTQHSPWSRVPPATAPPGAFGYGTHPTGSTPGLKMHLPQAPPCWTLWISACSSGWDSAFSLRASSRAWFCEELATSVCRRRPSSSRIWASFWATCSPWGRNAGTQAGATGPWVPWHPE